MGNSGRMLYVPKNVLRELDYLKVKKGKKKNKDCWDALIFYSDVGKNVDDVYGTIFGRQKR